MVNCSKNFQVLRKELHLKNKIISKNASKIKKDLRKKKKKAVQKLKMLTSKTLISWK